MSVIALAPALAIDGPVPVAPRYRLLSAEGVLGRGSDRWLAGVNVWGYPHPTTSTPEAGLPQLWEPCSEGTFQVKGSESDMPTPRFDSFVCYLPVVCKSGWVGDPDALRERARAALVATLSRGVEEQLSQGTGVVSNPYFGDVNLDVLAAGSHPPLTALAYLEEAIGTTGRAGMVHLTPPVAASLGHVLERDGERLRVSGTGTPVVVGHGYQGADPVSAPSPAAGQSWIFATGQVEVYVSELEVVPETAVEALDRESNLLTYRAEVSVLAMWDTGLQAGVLCDWSP